MALSKLIIIILGLVGVIMTLVLDIYCILIGRLIYGFAGGLLNVAIPRYIYEAIPA
jgi:hypothetical protein